MVIFRTALDALDFVVALENETGDDRIRIRAGIHVGSARIIEDDIFGNMVNFTKRVENTQIQGGITLSDVAKREIANEKAARHAWLFFEPLQATFKGLPEQELVWLVITPSNAPRLLATALLTKLQDIKLR
jgi:class 3 adenylate cyclase